MQDVDWGDLDFLIVDLPPGTGDAQLTMVQKVPLSGAVIVSTPQDVALLDAIKAINMFDKVSVPILGLIENMSHYHCPECGHESHIFGNEGAKHHSTEQNIPFLGQVPISLELRKSGDQGIPLTASNEHESVNMIFDEITAQIIGQLLPESKSAQA